METPDFISPMLWPQNSPDLNPVDYKVWSVMQEKVYKKRIKDIELRARILTAWDKIDQRNERIIDKAVRQWRTSQAAQSRQPCVNSHHLSQWEALGNSEL